MTTQRVDSTPANDAVRERWVVGLALVYPTAFTWLYFVTLADSPAWLQQSVYSIGKLVQFGFPIFWAVLICRERLTWPQRPWSGMTIGIGLGVAIVAVMFGLRVAWLQPSGLLDAPAEAVRQRVTGAGIDTPAKYVLLAVFYSAMHSFLEESYWRWFVFARLARMMSLWLAIGISSIGFMAHHVVVLSQFFGWSSPLTVLFSISVAVGGVAWAWLYHRSQSLVASWFSHLLVDAGIFWIGHQMLVPAL